MAVHLFISLISLLLYWKQNVPDKPSQEYSLNFEVKMKDAPVLHQHEVSPVEPVVQEPPANTTAIPFLLLQLKMNTLATTEKSVYIYHGSDLLLNKRAKVNDTIQAELGFVTDLKEGIITGEYLVQFVDKNKQLVSKISIYFDKEGAYFVNGTRYGKL